MDFGGSELHFLLLLSVFLSFFFPLSNASLHVYSRESFKEVGNSLLLSGGSEGIAATRVPPPTSSVPPPPSLPRARHQSEMAALLSVDLINKVRKGDEGKGAATADGLHGNFCKSMLLVGADAQCQGSVSLESNFSVCNIQHLACPKQICVNQKGIDWDKVATTPKLQSGEESAVNHSGRQQL